MNNLDQEFDRSSVQEKTSLLEPLRIHFRCPDCSKLYTSDPEKIFVENPEYTCTSCDADFSISLLKALESPEVVGVKKRGPVLNTIDFDESSEVQKKKPETLDLQASNTDSNTVSLGLTPQTGNLDGDFVQSKLPGFEALDTEEQTVCKPSLSSHSHVQNLIQDLKDTPRTRTHFSELNHLRDQSNLNSLWQGVLDNYTSRDHHSAFIEQCQKTGSMDFALHTYGKVLQVNPHDKIASSFVAKMGVQAEMQGLADSEAERQLVTRSFYITLAIVTMGLIFILMGLVFGENKNLAGLGIALIFFTFAVKAFFQPRRH